MPKFTTTTRRMIILGIFTLSLIGGIMGQWEVLKYGLVGLLTLISSDKDE